MEVIDNRPLCARVLKTGDRVVHLELGPCTVIKTVKSSGAVVVRMDEDGVVGTVSAQLLNWNRRPS